MVESTDSTQRAFDSRWGFVSFGLGSYAKKKEKEREKVKKKENNAGLYFCSGGGRDHETLLHSLASEQANKNNES